MCRNETEVYTWLASFFSDENFSLDKPITQDSVDESLSEGAPVLVPTNGYDVAIMFGEEGTIQENTERFVHTNLFRLHGKLMAASGNYSIPTEHSKRKIQL